MESQVRSQRSDVRGHMSVVERITLMVKLAVRARRAKRLAGNSRIIGLTGRAMTEIAPEGTIFLRNELWRARSSVKIVPGETVRVTGFAGLTLEVDPDAQRGEEVIARCL